MTTPNSTTAANIAGSRAGDARHAPAPGSPPWSKQLSERFAMDFGDELNQWWDQQCSHSPGPHSPGPHSPGPGEFRYPVMPSTLLSAVPDPIWPPLMPPNFLPLVGNGAGDWLCMRLLDPDVAARTGQATDFCQWYHGGGDWLPWGGRLSEALLFDWLLSSLPQSDRRHAEAAGERVSASTDPPTRDDGSHSAPSTWHDHGWGRWVIGQLPGLSDVDWAASREPRQLADDLLTLGLCEVPVRCQLVIDALASSLSGRLTPKLANDLGITWNDWMQWCFDLRTLPRAISDQMQRSLGLGASDFDPAQQRWGDVAEHAAAICQRHPDLSWGYDLLGYASWSGGDAARAHHAFSHGIRCSVFTDQSVRLRTHWATATDGIAKFSARFLAEMSPSPTIDRASEEAVGDQLGRLPAEIDGGQLLQYLGPHTNADPSSARQRYSQMLVDAAAAAGSPATSARLLYAAGWDLGAGPMQRYGGLLDRYIGACAAAGWTSHERLASVHRDGLKARYNL